MKELNFFSKIFWLLVALSASAVVFNSCDDDNESGGNGGNGGGNNNPGIGEATLTTDPGVVINGVRWATRNVDGAGTFAPAPESFGKFYQWSRRTAWSVTEPGEGILMPNWNAAMPTGPEWTRANDPSPTGWRVPTEAEILSLRDTDRVNSEWTTQNGVAGRKFTDRRTGESLFLPAPGFRFGIGGELYFAGAAGVYWSSMQNDNGSARSLMFGMYDSYGDGTGMGVYGFSRTNGYSVRSVIVLNSPSDNNQPGDGNGSSSNPGIPTPTTDPGIVINGVKWATRNVDAIGTFAPTPESFGKIYQWNRNTAWSTTEPGEGVPVPNWNHNTIWDTEWRRANDPSPAGWRVPTHEEMQSLFDTKKVSYDWVTQNGVAGGKFTDRATGNNLFLPAVGFREVFDGILHGAGNRGIYWDGTANRWEENVTGWDFGNSNIGWYGGDDRLGFSIRSVAE